MLHMVQLYLLLMTLKEKYYAPDKYWLFGLFKYSWREWKRYWNVNRNQSRTNKCYKCFSLCVDINNIQRVLGAVFLLCTYQGSKIFSLEAPKLNALLTTWLKYCCLTDYLLCFEYLWLFNTLVGPNIGWKFNVKDLLCGTRRSLL